MTQGNINADSATRGLVEKRRGCDITYCATGGSVSSYCSSPTRYAARALGTTDVENAHCVLNHLDKRRVQTSSAEEVSRQISNLQRIILLRRRPVGRELYQPVSSIYRNPETGKDMPESLTSGDFDQTRPSNRSREVRQFQRHLPSRGTLSVRSLGGHKAHEGNFMKG